MCWIAYIIWKCTHNILQDGLQSNVLDSLHNLKNALTKLQDGLQSAVLDSLHNLKMYLQNIAK